MCGYEVGGRDKAIGEKKNKEIDDLKKYANTIFQKLQAGGDIQALQKRRIEMLCRVVTEKVEAIQTKDEIIENLKKKQKCDN